jgi:hypothetical protein
MEKVAVVPDVFYAFLCYFSAGFNEISIAGFVRMAKLVVPNYH